jgi:hypothetical protein
MEQNRFRTTLLGLYEDQVIDNLIRVFNCRPIVQLAYTGITGEVADTVGAGVSGSQTDTAGAITNLFMYNGTGMSVNKLSVIANPIVDGGSQDKVFKENTKFKKDEEIWQYERPESIYKKYIEFVWQSPPNNDQNQDTSSQEQDDEHAWKALDKSEFSIPREGDGDNRNADADNADNTEVLPPGMLQRVRFESDIPEHHVKKFHKEPNDSHGYWYYVPRNYRREYFELAMDVTFGLKARTSPASSPDATLNELRLQRLSR